MFKRSTALMLALAMSVPMAALAQSEDVDGAEGVEEEAEAPLPVPPAEEEEVEGTTSQPEDAGETESEGESESVEPPVEPAGGEPLDLSFDLPVVGHTTFSMTSTTTVRYRGSNYDDNLFDDDFASVQQRFDLVLQGDELRLEVRLDGFLPFAGDEMVARTGGMAMRRPGWFASQAVGAIDGPNPGGAVCPDGLGSLCYLAWDVRPERITLRWEHESWSVEAGDSQLVFGRGIALSFRKVDLLGIDNALRGGHVRYDDGHFRARVHFGLANPQNQDPITLRIFQDPEDIIAGASIGATFGPADIFNTSAHVVRAWFANDPEGGSSLTNRTVDVAGWTFEAPALADGQLALYAEANGMRRSSTRSTGEEDISFGRAVYASAQLLVENLTILVEWKDYANFLVAPSALEGNAFRIYNAAPNLEFDGPQRLRAIGNQRGGSIRMDYGFLPGPWSFSVNTSLFGLEEHDPTHDPWNGILVSHSWASITRRQEYGDEVTWSVTATGGYRAEMCIRDCQGMEQPHEIDRSMSHGQFEVTLSSGEHGFDLTVDHRFEQQRNFDHTIDDFQIGGAALTYTYTTTFSAALVLRWTDQRQDIVDRRRAQAYNFLGGEFYPSLELRYNFDAGTFLRVFVGMTPGGLICSGGVCREVPPYEGVLAQFVGRI
jgi:hypothetical protein